MDRIKNVFDKIGSLIPGYKGYAERDGRRNCDKILRDSISSMLTESEKNIYSLMKDALKIKDKSKMNELEEVRKETNTLLSKVKFAPYGATSFFSDNQIKEEETAIDLDNKRFNESKAEVMEGRKRFEKNLVQYSHIMQKANRSFGEGWM